MPRPLRVALARAVVTGPELLILDEPLEQFDTRGREEVWDEIRRLRGELGVTTLLLTRVVPEALAHADRLAVMDLGRIIQVGPPQELYNHPVDVFVARLLGPTNLLQGQIDSNGSESRREVVVRTPLGRLVAKASGSGSDSAQGTPVTISIRPETLSLGPRSLPTGTAFPPRSSGSSSAAPSARWTSAGPATGRSRPGCSRTSLPASARARV